VADYTYKKSIYSAETIELKALPWYKNYRVLSIILLIVTTILVGFFW
jgi:SSS family solute:Na+ symporter